MRPSPHLPLLVCALAASSAFVAPLESREPTNEVRALWVTRATLTSPAAVSQMVRAAKDGRFNTLIVQVRARGDAYYASTIEPRASELAQRPDFDPLRETLSEAHRAGLSVHAWIVVNLVSSAFELPASRDHLVYRQPDWLMVPRDLAREMLAVDPRSPEFVGRLARWTRPRSNDVEGLYLSPLHPSVSKHLADVVGEIVTNYPVDGIHLDYARYPNEQFDYSRTALQQFKQAIRPELSAADRTRADAREAIDPLAYPTLFVDRWYAFRRARLTAIVMRLRTVIKAARPNTTLSAAVMLDVDEAFETRLQDWRTWLDQSVLDVLCPMVYTRDLDVFERHVASARELAGHRPVWVGIGAYRLSPAETLQHIAAARRLNAAGVSLFSYEALTAPPNSATSFAQLSRAAFASGSC